MSIRGLAFDHRVCGGMLALDLRLGGAHVSALSGLHVMMPTGDDVAKIGRPCITSRAEP